LRQQIPAPTLSGLEITFHWSLSAALADGDITNTAIAALVRQQMDDTSGSIEPR
jgi:hypothetical protein